MADKGNPVVITKTLRDMKILPAPEGTCPICATAHPPEYPHNQRSVFYQYKFYQENGRFPTWADALAHCTPLIRVFFIEALAKRGIIVDERQDGM
jgi:hypothetical protein